MAIATDPCGSPPANTHWLLAALQLSDSFFPSGLFTLSHGLEAFVQSGLDPQDLEALLTDYLEHVIGPSDALAVLHAHRSAAARDLVGIIDVDRTLYAVKLAREGREASCRVGRRLITTASVIRSDTLVAEYAKRVQTGQAPGTAPVALAVAAQSCGIGEHEAMLMELYTFSASFLGAAMRLMRIDHLDIQRIVARLGPTLERVISTNGKRPVGDIRTCAPMIDMMAMMHETAEVRLFVS